MKKILIILLLCLNTCASAQTSPSWFQLKDAPVVDVTFSRAKGDGVTDDTAAIQASIDSATAINGVVLLYPGKTYRVSRLVISNGLRGLYGYGSTITTDSTATAPVELSPGVDDLVIAGVTINSTVGCIAGIYADSCTNSKFRDIKLTGEYTIAALYLDKGCKKNTVVNCNLTGGVTHHRRGVALIGVLEDIYGGYYADAGVCTNANPASTENIVTQNNITSFDFPIFLSGADNNIVSENNIYNSTERAIILSPVCSSNSVINNHILDNRSTGIHLGYGSSDNIISGNRIDTESAAGTEAMLQCYIGCKDNTFSNNSVYGNSRYGFYTAINSQRNKFIGNHLSGNFPLAAVAIEEEWADTPPASATFSRPNYAPPIAPAIRFATDATKDNEFVGNTITQTATGGAPIFYLAQIGSFSLDSNVIKDNIIPARVNEGFVLYHYAANTASSANNIYVGNVTRSPSLATYFYSTYGRASYAKFQQLNDSNGTAFVYFPPVNATTVSAFYSDLISVANYTASTTITDFTDGMNGQQISVQLRNGVTIKYDANKIRNTAFADITGNSNTWIRFLRYGNIWYQQD